MYDDDEGRFWANAEREALIELFEDVGQNDRSLLAESDDFWRAVEAIKYRYRVVRDACRMLGFGVTSDDLDYALYEAKIDFEVNYPVACGSVDLSAA